MRTRSACSAPAGTTFRNSYVSLPALLPLPGDVPHRAVRAQPRRPRTDQRYTDLDSANTLAVWLRSREVPDRDGRQVPERLRDRRRHPRAVPTPWRSRRAGADGSRSPAGPSSSRYGFKLNENGQAPLLQAGQPGNYIDYVLAAKVNGLRQGRAPKPEAVLPLLQPEQPSRRGGRFAIWSTRDPEPAPRHLGAARRDLRPAAAELRRGGRHRQAAAGAGASRVSPTRRSPTSTAATAAGSRACSPSTTRSTGIVGLVRKYGDKRKTFFIFTSDNGVELGAHRIEFKNFLYEEGDARSADHPRPRLPGGETRTSSVANIDLAPTIAPAHQGSAPDWRDGRPLAAACWPVTRPTRTNRDLLFESQAYDGSAGIRRGPLGLHLDDNGDDGALQPRRPTRTSSRTSPQLPAFAGIRAQLDARLAQIRACAGASCP